MAGTKLIEGFLKDSQGKSEHQLGGKFSKNCHSLGVFGCAQIMASSIRKDKKKICHWPVQAEEKEHSSSTRRT